MLDEARRNGAALPVTALVDQFYRQVQQSGGGRGDTSSLILNLRRALTPRHHGTEFAARQACARATRPPWRRLVGAANMRSVAASGPKRRDE